jgi:ADP-heptose:LPS heptosyltransferase
LANPWRPTLRKRLILHALDFAAHVPGVLGKVRSEEPYEAVNDILVIELWNIGDLVLAMPFLAQLRAIFPKARITLLGRPYARDVLGGTGLVDEYLTAQLDWWKRPDSDSSPAYAWREMWRVMRQLRRRRFDVAFKSRMHVREHILLAATPARRKIAHRLGAGDSVLTDAIPGDLSKTHKVDDWMSLLGPLGGPVSVRVPALQTPDAESRWAEDLLTANGVSGETVLIGIHPGASMPEKRWPVERFVAVAKALVGKPTVRVVAFADPDGYGSEVAEVRGVIPATTLTLSQLTALIGRCRVLVCNDSGPMHLAAAMRVPAIAIFGTSVERWFSPLGENHILLGADSDGSPTTEPAVERIYVTTVLKAVERALE